MPDRSASPMVATPRYYRKVVRSFFIANAIIILFGASLYSGALTIELPLEIVGALTLMMFAALTNGEGAVIQIIDALVAIIGVAIFGAWGLLQIESIGMVASILRMLIAALFLFAFYFNVKTMRIVSLRLEPEKEESPIAEAIEHVIEDIEQVPRDTEPTSEPEIVNEFDEDDKEGLQARFGD